MIGGRGSGVPGRPGRGRRERNRRAAVVGTRPRAGEDASDTVARANQPAEGPE